MGFSLHFEKNDALFLVRPGWHSMSTKHLPWGTPENSLSGCGARFSKSWHSYISVVPSKTIPDTRQCPDQNRQSQYPYSDRNSAAHDFYELHKQPPGHLLMFTSFHEKKKNIFLVRWKKKCLIKHFYNILSLRRRFFYPSPSAIVNVYFTEGIAVVRPRRWRFYKQKEIKCSLKLNLLFGIKQNKLSRNLNEIGAQNIDYNPNLLRFLTDRSVYLPKEATMDRI